ncbi:MAG: hypothetical protein EP343_00865 [Deltaproteobacteria bacterium]|nr:MAG: hypothetical protein EP343_00865 [Deltaproteobacteria bacterium]
MIQTNGHKAWFLALCCSVLLCILSPRRSHADVFTDVPEAQTFKLVYSLSIPLRGGYLTTLPSYQTDNSKTLSGSIRRIAYYLSIQPKSGKRQFVYVSMDAFSQNLQEIGVPSGLLNVNWQRNINNMNVVSNVSGIANGKGIQGGNLEFWPTNYETGNTSRVPGASDTVYDSGDNPVASGGYGSMQIHNHRLGLTLLAYNSWGLGNADCDLGIGNNTVKASNGLLHKDWTFRHNCSSYTQRTLQVLVEFGKPPAGSLLRLDKPIPRQVIQRQANNKAWVTIAGEANEVPSSVEARVVAKQGGATTPWQVIVASPTSKKFSGRLEVQAGWYELQVRFRKNGAVVDTQTLEPFGVGEVLIIAGQSNSANSGKPPQKAKDPRVMNYGFGNWVPAVDPMLIATGNGGSPWPLLGDHLAGLWNVPIGILSVGWGGTRVDQWLPLSTDTRQLYLRLKDALAVVGLRGARAVLWHQGESDSSVKTSQQVYAQRLNAVIQQSRKDAGWDIPWYIAGVSYLPNSTAAAKKAIRDAQDQVVANHPQNFAGPTTDDLTGATWRHDNVHFNQAGLAEHAKRWLAVLRYPPCQRFPQQGDECAPGPEPEPAEEPDTAAEAVTDGEGEPFSPDDSGAETEPVVTPEAGREESTNEKPITEEPITKEPVPESQGQQDAAVAPEPSESGDSAGFPDANTDTAIVQPPEQTSPSGCGCQQTEGDLSYGLLVMWVVLVLGLFRRRRSKPRSS